MMRRVALILLLTICASCGMATPPNSTVTPPALPTPRVRLPVATPTARSLASIVLSTEGTIEVKRQGWSAFQPLTAPALVYAGDTIRVDTDGQARLMCSDFATIWQPH